MTTIDIHDLLIELDEVRNGLISTIMRMEKLLKTNSCTAIRAEVKKLRELVK